MYIPKPTEGGDFTPPPAGTFPATCYRVVDLGTQETTYMGETKKQHKVLLSWELKDDEAILETEDGPQPMTIHQRYTWSMHEKATLRKHLESWRGKAFTEADFGDGGFDIKNVLGVPCFIGIVHNTKGEKTYANISAISKLPKNMEVSEPVNPVTYLWLHPDRFDREVFGSLSDGLQNAIKASPEYRELMNGAPVEHVVDADNGAGVTGHLDDPIPFAPETR